MRTKFAGLVLAAAITALALAPARADAINAFVFTGTVRVVHVQARTITVQAAGDRLHFAIDADATLVAKDKSTVRLAAIKPGDVVEVHYTKEPWGFDAHEISETGL